MHFHAAGHEPEVARDARVRLVVIVRILEHVFFGQKVAKR
jgi:hypothetical protein